MHLQEEVPKAEGLISYQKLAPTSPEDRQQLFVAFSEADLKSRGLRFSRGDMVEFVLGSDPKTGRQTASQVNPASQSPQRRPEVLLHLLVGWINMPCSISKSNCHISGSSITGRAMVCIGCVMRLCLHARL